MFDSYITATYDYVTKVKFNKSIISTLDDIFEDLEEGISLADALSDSLYI